ncbi:MAG: DUF2500 domain-containing protein [Oscillospiraceae bacterium]
MNSFSFFGNIMMTIVPIIVVIGFILVFVSIISQLVRSSNENHKNNNSPILTVEAKVVAKRADIQHYNRNNSNDNFNHSTTTTKYYATFEFESKDRMEFLVPENEYGYIIEQDMGKLNFQGTRFLSFERTK